MTEAEYEAKFKDMQKYIPFLQKVIEKLKVNYEPQGENPRKAQLQKMEMLHDLLTNKTKKIKMETLIKCEGVLIKLHAKVEKCDDSTLNNAKAKEICHKPAASITTSENAKDKEIIDITGPASPPPEIIPIELNQPVVIPTERRCSPIHHKKDSSISKHSDYHSKSDERSAHHNKSSDKSQFSVDVKKNRPGSVKHDSCKDDLKNRNPIPTVINTNWKNKNFLREETKSKKEVSVHKSPNTVQKVQTVKVVITEPLADHIKQKHFPSTNKFMPRASICHNNLKTLPQAPVKNAEMNEAYNPEDLWNKYNDSNKKTGPVSSKPSIFSRLGEKIIEEKPPTLCDSKTTSISTSGRYTPIPDVLKSPPLSATDINNLLLESGVEKSTNDISEIGTRRPPKTENNQKRTDSSPSQILEFARKKLAQTAKLYSPNSEVQQSPKNMDNSLGSPLPQERIALKYNPHPRQERLQSISSTDGSECSVQIKRTDPRIKSKLPPSNTIISPSPTNPANVNVLPTINLNDPRLKKQHITSSALTTHDGSIALTKPLSTGQNQIPGYGNSNMICYPSKLDPRNSRVPSTASSGGPAIGFQGLNKSQQHLSSEEDKNCLPIESDARFEYRDSSRIGNKVDYRHNIDENQSKMKKTKAKNQSLYNVIPEKERAKPNPPKSDSEEGWDNNSKSTNKAVQKNSASKSTNELSNTPQEKPKTYPKNSNTSNYLPRPPNSDTEEDWDSEPEPAKSNVKSNASTNASPNIPLNKKPSVPELISPVPNIQLSPKTFGNHIINSPLLPTPPQHLLQNPYAPTHYSNNQPLLMPNSTVCNRFNALLNDKTEREKYFESKKQKPFQPRTYKEFREAKKRQLAAQEAAIKRASEEEAEKRAEELKSTHKSKEPINCDKKEDKTDKTLKINECKAEKKSNQLGIARKSSHASKDQANVSAESTLDKMYRTQNFGTTFPKANISFKIPKKKTEDREKTKDVTAATKIEEKSKTEEKTIQNASHNNDSAKSTHKAANDNIPSENVNETKEVTCSKNRGTENAKQQVNKMEENLADIGMSSKTKQNEEQKSENKNELEKIADKNISCNSKNINIRDPRRKPKDHPNLKSKDDIEYKERSKNNEENILKDHPNLKSNAIEDKEKSENKEENILKDHPNLKSNVIEDKEKSENKEENILRDIVITSYETEVVLKPQQKSDNPEDKNKTALDKFNEIAQALNPKPQRILRRRNTMVAFDSAPLVDKDKLKKANAMLFEDIQEEEKRKQKQAEEDRQNARRNKHLEEMFQKTDDNCTVSTQNIIVGKRRTRATINFNETVNAINVFKHISKKDSADTNSNSTTPQTVPSNIKNTRSTTKRVIQNAETLGSHSINDNHLENFENSQDQSVKAAKKIETKSNDNFKPKDNVDKNKRLKTNLKVCIKLPKNVSAVNKIPPSSATTTILTEEKNESAFRPIHDNEQQNCAVSSTSADTTSEEQLVCSTSLSNTVRSVKKEADDNEPTSTANKSNNPTPTPDASVQVLDEIVDKMLRPNADRVHILGLLGQILSEEKLKLIKSLIENNSQQNEEQTINNKEDENKLEFEDNVEVNETEIKPLKNYQEDKATIKKGKRALITKKKRNELDRLNEDIRDMFICEGVLTATGRRMCTIMGQSNNKGTDLVNQNKSALQSSIVAGKKNDKATKKKDQKTQNDKNKTIVVAGPLRRSLRGCKITNEENDDEDSVNDDDDDDDDDDYNETNSIHSRTTEESIDDLNNTSDTNNTESNVTPQKKMPVLKPNTPIKLVDEECKNSHKPKNKRKSNSKCSTSLPIKKAKSSSKDNSKERTDFELEKETEGDEEKPMNKNIVKNTNLNWHNQSKFTAWCMVCEKKIQSNTCGSHYKIHHGENYISRLPPVLLQQFKQGKLSQPLFGVDKNPKQSSWFYRCPFCLQYFNTILPLWLEHFQNHTTEFRFECSKCHYGSNKLATTRRHLTKCKGATLVNTAIKLSIPTLIKGHVCHLCNYLQLRRVNLERHYIEQHKLNKNTVELLGYTINLFDVENVELVSEDKATEREKQVWESIEKEEQIIDIDDEDEDKNKQTEIANKEVDNTSNAEQEEILTSVNYNGKEKPLNDQSQQTLTEIDNNIVEQEPECENSKQNVQESSEPKDIIIRSESITDPSDVLPDSSVTNENQESNVTKASNDDENKSTNEIESETAEKDSKVQSDDNESFNNGRDQETKESEIINIDYELVNEKETVQDIQEELLALADKAAEDENENGNQTTTDSQLNNKSIEPEATMSDISSSIDMLYSRNSSRKRKSNENETVTHPVTKKSPNIVSNAFMPTRDENNSSPTIQILAQSIINIEEEAQQTENPLKAISIADRLAQRLRGLQNRTNCSSNNNTITTTPTTTAKETETETIINNSKNTENAFEKLINDTVLELEKEKEKDNIITSNQPLMLTHEGSNKESEINLNKKSLEIEKDTEKEKTNLNENKISELSKDLITVISDDEDWEDIEITETAPAICSTKSGNIQKTKSKGLFQKFGIFKGNSSKPKKHIPPLVCFQKKKPKEKTLVSTVTSSSPISTSTIDKVNTTTSTTTTTLSTNVSNDTQTGYCNTHLGFKPVVNIMDDLLPDSPCNDPIDLVPELAPLEPLQDLNDISSILDSNLCALESSVNINASENHASIEDALDFISEQQASDIQCFNTSLNPSQSKTIINSISHVGYSVQTVGESAFKFYCLLQNCSFLFSSDSVGLENHFLCEHSRMKWNGYCLMCQAQCFPNSESNESYSISQEIRHMLDKHANKPNVELITDSTTQHSTTSSQGSEERPKIKLRRLTGDCLSRAALDDTALNQNIENRNSSTTSAMPMSMLSALLVAKPKPPTKDMPPQPQMPLTEPLLLDNNNKVVTTSSAFKNVSNEFLITSVTSAANLEKETPLKISNVLSLQEAQPMPTPLGQTQMPIISDVCTLAPKQIEAKHQQQHVETAGESLEVSQILANAGKPSLQREASRTMDDSPGPIVVAETLPIAQNKTGDFLITQTVSAQYNDFTSAAVGINISIAPASSDTLNKETLPAVSSIPITSRHYKCKANGCKFLSRVPVAMSDHLRFHERRNFSSKRDYFDCAFCSYQATDVDDYMKHTNQYHIINKGGISATNSTSNETNTAKSLTKKINDILNNTNGSNNNIENQQQIETTQVQDTHEVYLEKLKATIEEIVGPTGLADDQLYRCVVKNCRTQLTEATFLNHIMYHITTVSSNPNSYIFKCPHCSAQYHRAAGIKVHIKNHARNRFFCYLCQDTATNPGQLLKHFSDKHWHTLNMYTHELVKPKTSSDGSEEILESAYYVVYTQELNEEEVKKFGEKLILEWQRKKSGSKTHFKSSEIDLLPMSAIFQREINCGECEYKTKVRTNMYRHLQMHKQNPGANNSSGGVIKVCSVDPVNPVPCLNSNERFFDKMTNLASSSLIPSTSSSAANNTISSNTTKLAMKIPYKYIPESKRYHCGCPGCNYQIVSEDIFRIHLSTRHSSEMSYRCRFCKEEICKRGIGIERIMNHLRFHGSIIYRCEECNYVHHLRYVVERHINERHATMKINIIVHDRTNEDNEAGTIQIIQFAGKKYRETTDNNNIAQSSSNCELSITAFTIPNSSNNKGKGKWLCDVCGHKALNVNQIQSHCQQQHGVKNQYKCAHCNFGSQQLSQILYHIDEKHSGKTREARSMYHKLVTSNEEVADTRPLWQRNDPTRIRHIRGILMEDEEESEQYRKNLGLTDDVDNNETREGSKQNVEQKENNEDLVTPNYIRGYEFVCFHCDFKTQIFEDLKTQHYKHAHNSKLELAKPFWFRLQRRFCCPECRTFIGNYCELQQHIQHVHQKSRYYAADISMAEYEDSSQRIPCGYCSFHCSNVEQLYRHHLKMQHYPKDIRIDHNRQLMKILEIGEKADLYQCSLCTDIYPNRVAAVHHDCNNNTNNIVSIRDIKDDCMYRCIACQFTNTEEKVMLRHMIDHYSRFTVCQFCQEQQSSFNVYMQHCYAEHRTEIQKFRTIYTMLEIEMYLMQMLIIFRNGLVLTKHNLIKTQYGNTNFIIELYEEMYKISQQPPIPRLSIARLVARKSIEAQQKQQDSPHQGEILESLQTLSRAKGISKRRCTVAVSQEDHQKASKKTQATVESMPASILKRRTTIFHDNPTSVLKEQTTEFNAPLQTKKISKRRCTVAVDRDTLFSKNLSNSFSNSLLVEREFSNKKRKLSHTTQTSQCINEATVYPLNLDMEPFSFYGKKPENVDLTKIYTKVVIGGIKTPLTIDKFKLLFDIECQLKLTKCDNDLEAVQTLSYNDYKHIQKACPASHKLIYN